MTRSGASCKRWRDVDLETPIDGRNHKYCRNPDNDANGPWCYVDFNGDYEYCDIPNCGGNFLFGFDPG